jgi:hypothetical protein
LASATATLVAAHRCAIKHVAESHAARRPPVALVGHSAALLFFFVRKPVFQARPQTEHRLHRAHREFLAELWRARVRDGARGVSVQFVYRASRVTRLLRFL